MPHDWPAAADAGVSSDHVTISPCVLELTEDEASCEMCSVTTWTEGNWLVWCDACPRAYHTQCIQPALDAVPDSGEWLCPKCSSNGVDDSNVVQIIPAPTEEVVTSSHISARRISELTVGSRIGVYHAIEDTYYPAVLLAKGVVEGEWRVQWEDDMPLDNILADIADCPDSIGMLDLREEALWLGEPNMLCEEACGVSLSHAPGAGAWSAERTLSQARSEGLTLARSNDMVSGSHHGYQHVGRLAQGAYSGLYYVRKSWSRHSYRLGVYQTPELAALCLARHKRAMQRMEQPPPRVVAATTRHGASSASSAMRLGKRGRDPAPSGDGADVAEIVDANDGYTRFLVRHSPRGKPLWEPLHKLPPPLVATFVEARQVRFNRSVEPLLTDPTPHSGVVCVSVPRADAHACARHLQTYWLHGSLPLANGYACTGYASYGKVLSQHDAALQRQHTLLFTSALLPYVRAQVPGFHAIEDFLMVWLEAQYGTVVELFYAHGLRQGPLTLASTAFSVHQDTEDYDFIEYTVVVKLTPDADGEPPSAMRVVGAPIEFEYGPGAGDGGAFRARAYHASVAPKDGARECLKVAFFFRRSVKGERRAKRALAAYGERRTTGRKRATS